MINIAIVEDDDKAAETLLGCLNKYRHESGEAFEAVRFAEAESFLDTCRRQAFEIVFMDIEMPGMSGMEAAAKLREFDKKMVLIFVTNMAQYAVKGYEVNAMDYVLKPVNYPHFAIKIKKALDIVKTGENVEIIITQASGIKKLPVNNLFYIEVQGHKLLYHTVDGDEGGYGSLSDLSEKLKRYNFLRCNNCYLVNPKYIASVQGFTVLMKNGDALQISHPRKKAFMTELADWLGQGNFI